MSVSAENKVPDILYEGSKLIIPFDLYKQMSINIDSKLIEYVTMIDKPVKAFSIPSNVPVNFIEAGTTTEATYNLVIGDIVPQSDDIVVGTTPMETGAKENQEFPGMGEVSKARIEDKLKTLHTGGRENFFFTNEVESVDSQSKKVYMNVNNSIDLSNKGNVVLPPEVTINPANKYQLIVPQNGRIAIIKKADGTYKVEWSANGKNQLDIVYRNDKVEMENPKYKTEAISN